MKHQKHLEDDTERTAAPGQTGRSNKSIGILIGVAIAVVGIACILGGTLVGYMLAGRRAAPSTEAASSDSAPTTWYCSMHPQITSPKPGKCAICFMDLIPMEEDDGDELGPRQLRMSKNAVALAEIETTPVRRQYVTNPVRMVGKVNYDETRLADISAWVPGRLDRLYVDYTGIVVRKGDHLVSMYSPELVVTQRELLQNWERLSTARDKQMVETTPKSTEEKLRLLGLLDSQIEEIKRRGTPSDHLTIYAPVGGVVIRKYVNEGVYVKTGTKIYTIADLTRVWVHLDAYESDVPWIRYGQEVEFTTESYPGEVFKGRIAFIDPVLDEKTHTLKVRVNVPNAAMRLKPGMFVRAIVRSRLAAGGRVLDASLAGKWISPMHPEVIKDGPGKCDVCGMDLVPAEELFVVHQGDDEPPLVIPASAPLITGKRAVVYVRLPDEDQPTFEGREVVLGHRAGDFYIVRQGLEEGEPVVTNGAFVLDADLQLKARLSMMSAAGPPPLDVSHRFRGQLGAVYRPYLALQTALADDRLGDARAEWLALRKALDAVPTETIDPQVGEAWGQTRQTLVKLLALDPAQAEIDALRAPFEGVATAVLEMADRFGHALPEPLYESYCPMAFDNKGARWLQSGDTVDNPYFGHKMKRCGTIRREFAPAAHAPGKEAQP